MLRTMLHACARVPRIHVFIFVCHHLLCIDNCRIALAQVQPTSFVLPEQPSTSQENAETRHSTSPVTHN